MISFVDAMNSPAAWPPGYAKTFCGHRIKDVCTLISRRRAVDVYDTGHGLALVFEGQTDIPSVSR